MEGTGVTIAYVCIFFFFFQPPYIIQRERATRDGEFVLTFQPREKKKKKKQAEFDEKLRGETMI